MGLKCAKICSKNDLVPTDKPLSSSKHKKSIASKDKLNL